MTTRSNVHMVRTEFLIVDIMYNNIRDRTENLWGLFINDDNSKTSEFGKKAKL